jgi:aryl-alcohol dehydrogenase (NADP+)
MLPLCRSEGVAVIPWSPLARGFLAGNRTRAKSGETERGRTDAFAHQMYYQDADFQVADRCAELAQRRGTSSAQMALAWLLHQPGITAPIIGASKMYQLEEAVAALEIRLSPEEIKSLEEPYGPHRILGH